jgi:hypothetical protein
LADFEFNTLAAELDAYAKIVAEKTSKGDLDLELDATTIEAVLKRVKQKFTRFEYKNEPIKTKIVLELKDFGILKASDLDALFTDELTKAIDRNCASRTALGLIRIAMFWHDIEKYFAKAWKKDWKGFSPDTTRLLIEHYGKEKVEAISKRHSLKLPATSAKSN